MLKRLYPPVFVLMLLLALAIGASQLANPAVPALPAVGLILTAVAPLLFLLRIRIAPPAERTHPVIVSASMALGCAIIMIGIQRFGDEHQWLLVLALLALAGWMLYQRKIWRAPDSKA